jgi:hypothetical protein
LVPQTDKIVHTFASLNEGRVDGRGESPRSSSRESYRASARSQSIDGMTIAMHDAFDRSAEAQELGPESTEETKLHGSAIDRDQQGERILFVLEDFGVLQAGNLALQLDLAAVGQRFIREEIEIDGLTVSKPKRDCRSAVQDEVVRNFAQKRP